jgi:hypothetical protein
MCQTLMQQCWHARVANCEQTLHTMSGTQQACAHSLCMQDLRAGSAAGCCLGLQHLCLRLAVVSTGKCNLDEGAC